MEVLKHPDFFFVVASLAAKSLSNEKLREDRTLYIPAKQIVSPRWLSYFEMNLDFDDSEVNEPSNNANL